MNRRHVLAIAVGLALYGVMGVPVAQEETDLEGAKAASSAFYEALGVIDDGTAMEKVWANTGYVTFLGPRSKEIIVGWDALRAYWNKANQMFETRDVTLSEQHIHANGNLAWEMGREISESKMKDGTTAQNEWFVTNVFERQPDGRWLIVSHHVQPMPQ